MDEEILLKTCWEIITKFADVDISGAFKLLRILINSFEGETLRYYFIFLHLRDG